MYTKTMDHTSKPSLSKSLHQRMSRPCASPQEHSSTSTLFDFDTNGIDADNFNPCSGLRQATPRLRTLLSSDHRTERAATSTTNHVDHVSSGSAELRPRRPRPERLHRAPTTSTTRPRRNDDRREERLYDNRDHRHNRPKSTRTGQLYHHRLDFYQR